MFGRCVGYDAPAKHIRIMECEKGEADRVIVPNHYSHKVAQNSCINLLVLYHGRTCGAMQIGYGIRPKLKGYADAEKTREFDRMWLSDEMPKYSETICISLLHHYLRRAHPEIKHLISYADTSAGKTGIIYRAASYRFVRAIPADFYILENGERVHPVTMWHRHGTRKFAVLQTIYPNIRKAEGQQLKFIKDL